MPSDHALSESVSLTLMVCLLVILAVVSWGFFFGYESLLKTNINIAEYGEDVDTHLSAHAIRLFHQNGDIATLNASGRSGYHEAAFTLISPSGLVVSAAPSPLIADHIWQPGDSIFFYRDASGYHVTDSLTERIARIPLYGPLIDLEGGIWTIKTIDNTIPVTINSVQVLVGGSGTTSASPYTPGLIATYYSDQAWTIPVATNVAGRVYFADTASGRASDVGNWPNPYVGKTDSFSVQFEGFLRIDTEDDYTFTLSSDDGSFMDLGGTSNFISNGGLHSFLSVSKTRHMTPGYYPITVRMFENNGAAVVYLQYQTPSMGSPQIVTNLWHVPSTAPMADFTGTPRAGSAPLTVRFTDTSIDATGWTWNFGDGTPLSSVRNPVHTYTAFGVYPVTLTTSNAFGTGTITKADYITVGSFVPGFIASYYRGQSWTDLAGSRTESEIHFSDQSGSTWPTDIVGRQEDFSVTWDGYLNVPTEADYSFRLTSDDGSWLWIDEVQLIDNGGLHGSTAVTQTTHLTAGYHHIVVKMYENTGAAVAYLDYAISPSTVYSPVTGVYHIP